MFRQGKTIQVRIDETFEASFRQICSKLRSLEMEKRYSYTVTFKCCILSACSVQRLVRFTVYDSHNCSNTTALFSMNFLIFLFVYTNIQQLVRRIMFNMSTIVSCSGFQFLDEIILQFLITARARPCHLVDKVIFSACTAVFGESVRSYLL